MSTEAQRRAIKKYRKKLRNEMLANYGYHCDCCGEACPEFMTLEHIGNTGAEHRRFYGSLTAELIDLRRRGWPQDKYKILCMNCNWATRYGEICPHKVYVG